MRVKITIAYNGAHFFGLQKQKETDNTILGLFERILSSLGIESKIVASGRTDKGVHASGQVCHFDLPPFWSDIQKLQNVLNHKLPSTIYVKKIREVKEDFHARYQAKTRTYRYIIKSGERNPFEADFITFIQEIDFVKIEKNIKLFIGQHDFTEFMKQGSDAKSSIREIYQAFAYRYKGYIVLHFQANGFLRSQIRLMVGALLTLDAKEIREKLLQEATYKVKPAPPNGLYLAKITYKEI